MTDRGMKKWMPFASLTEYGSFYQQMLVDRNKKAKPELSEDQIYEINKALVNLKSGDEITFSYYFNGFIYHVTSQIMDIDFYKSRLLIASGIVQFGDIISIEDNSYFD